MKRIWIITFITFIYSAGGWAQSLDVSITSPADVSSVGLRPVVKGTVSDPASTVWVIVHPLETGDYWVQPRVKVSDDGTWEVRIYIGRPGSIDVDKLFEVRAVANPTTKLQEGNVLGGWPKAKASSYVIELKRE